MKHHTDHRRRTLQLIEAITPERPQDITPHDLPDSFPADLLDDDQLDAVAAWWAHYTTELIDRLRIALCATPGAPKKARCVQDLEHYILQAVALGHILRLHPACDITLSELAHHLGVNARALRSAKDTVSDAIMHPGRAAERADRRSERRLTIGRLGRLYPVLDIARAEGSKPVLIIPYRRHITLATQMTLALSISRYKNITCTLWETAAGENAIKITFHSPENRAKHAS